MSVGIQEIVTSTLQEKETHRDALTDQYSVLVSPYGKPEFETFTVQSVLVILDHDAVLPVSLGINSNSRSRSPPQETALNLIMKKYCMFLDT